MPLAIQFFFAIIGLVFAGLGAAAGIATLSRRPTRLWEAIGIVLILVAAVSIVFFIYRLMNTSTQQENKPLTQLPSNEPKRLPPAPPAPTIRTVHGFAYVEIPDGEASLGCEETDNECDEDDMHEFQYELRRPILLMREEVNWGQYRQCVSDDACRDNQLFVSPDVDTSEEQPVALVTAADASAFCAWAGGRLPSENEWEYAARLRVQGVSYAWGEHSVPIDVMYGRPVESGPGLATRGYMNAAGLRNMFGNVAEWCSASQAGEDFAVRGGSFNSDVSGLRFAARAPSDSTHMAETIGFRCAADE